MTMRGAEKVIEDVVSDRPADRNATGGKKVNPMRTIVSGIGTPTEEMAEVAEKELEEYVRKSPSFLQDTTDFLHKLDAINRKLPNEAILFCFDVEKLYSSILKKEGLAACSLRAQKQEKIKDRNSTRDDRDSSG